MKDFVSAEDRLHTKTPLRYFLMEIVEGIIFVALVIMIILCL